MIQRQRAADLVRAVAVDAARLALNMGVLSERVLIQDDRMVEMARAGKLQHDLLEESLRRGEELERALDAADRRHVDQARSWEAMRRAGQLDNERLKGRVDEEYARAEAALTANRQQLAAIATAELQRDEAIARFEALQRNISAATTITDEADTMRAELDRRKTRDAALRATFCERLYLPADTEWSGILPLIGKK